MSTKLTDKTWFIYYKGFQIWLSSEQAEATRALIKSGSKWLDIEGRLLKLEDCALMKGEDNERAEKLRRGSWMCEYGHWHTKNDECAHGSPFNNK